MLKAVENPSAIEASAKGLIGAFGGIGESVRDEWKKKTRSAAKNRRPVREGSFARFAASEGVVEATGDRSFGSGVRRGAAAGTGLRRAVRGPGGTKGRTGLPGGTERAYWSISLR